MPQISVNYVTARPTRGAMIGLEDTHLLEPTLESLKHQAFKDFEFVCVDLLYEKRTGMFEEWDLPFPVKHISARPDWWLEHGLWSGSAPRNKGIIAADDEAELIIIIDDCCEFGEDFLQRFWSWYEKGYFAMALTLYNMGGKPLYHEAESKKRLVEAQVKGWQDNYSENLDKVHGKGNRVRDSRWRFVERLGGVFNPPPDMYYGYSSVSMEALLKVNGYDEKLDGDKALIDVDMGLRLAQAGYSLFVLDEKLTVTENSHYGVPAEILFWDGGTIKSNYNIMKFNQRKKRWKANSQPLDMGEVEWILNHRDPLEKHIPIYEPGSKQHKILMEWAKSHQRVFDLREMRLLGNIEGNYEVTLEIEKQTIKVLMATVCTSPAVTKETLEAIRKLETDGLIVDWFIGTEQLEDSELYTRSHWTVGKTIAHNLDKARKLALWEDYDYLFVLESDVIPPSNTLQLMIEDDGDIVSGIVPERVSKVGVNIIQLLYYPKHNGTGHHDTNYEGLNYLRELLHAGKPFEIEREMRCNIGRCCLLVNRSVMEHPFHESDGVWTEKMRELGFKIIVDPRVACAHIDRDGSIMYLTI